MKIKNLKLNDLVIENSPDGLSTESMVYEKPFKKEDYWYVDTVTRTKHIFTYKQYPDGKIENHCGVITELIFSPNN